MILFFYRLFIRLYPFALKLISPFNKKAGQWLRGRKNIFQKMNDQIKHDKPIIWFHCSSLGEFEQGRPLIEKLKAEFATHCILLTFFSPSGYEIRKDYKGADYIFYLPMDSRNNAKEFYSIINPKMVVFVKYEFWNYYLQEAKNRNIPLLLISGIFRKDQPFFSWHGGFHRKMLNCFTHFFVQNSDSTNLLASIGFTKNVTIAGDTRFDRVIEIAETEFSFPLIEQFIGQADVVVAGSTWTEDDKELDHYANTRTHIKFIIAPHNIGEDRIKECLHLYNHSGLLSQLKNGNMPAGANTLIIDNIGMLNKLYKYATVSYVGGGFGRDGVHNILEAAVFGKPVVFGPEFEKFPEAGELIDAGGGFTVNNPLDLEVQIDSLLKKDSQYLLAGNASKKYVYSKTGSTQIILNYIQEKRLLTN